jgi:cell wall-associated NlpC family hydrolase
LRHGQDITPQQGQSIDIEASLWKGTPYLWGGDTPKGADCSGSSFCIYSESGFPYNRESSAGLVPYAETEGTPLRVLNANEVSQPGDLLIFSNSVGITDHVAIYAGQNNGIDMMWTAHHTGGAPYSEIPVRSWSSAPIDRLRYQIPSSAAIK